MLKQEFVSVCVPEHNGYAELPPKELPDLRRVGILSLDTETRDYGLQDGKGSGWPFGQVELCGISAAWREGGETKSLYIPVAHPDSENYDIASVTQWVKDLFASNVRIIAQNSAYDYGTLQATLGVAPPPADRMEEIGALATMVDENRHSCSLDNLCAWRNIPGKDRSSLEEAANALGLKIKSNKLVANLWQFPARYVAPYAETDAVRTLELFENLYPILAHEGTEGAYRLEVALLPIVIEMRRRGIRIDVDHMVRARDYARGRRDVVLLELSGQLGEPVGMDELLSPIWLKATFDRLNIKYPHTSKNNPSFKAGKDGWMVRDPHWLPRGIAQARKYNACAETFLDRHILGHIHNGRIHAELHPHRTVTDSDDNPGTRSSRFSYSNPPLQQMPVRDKELGPLIRAGFLPEEGEVWCKPDFSQQEFRLFVHDGVVHNLPGAAEAAERYHADPQTDFHKLVGEIVGIERDPAKAVNFAKAYSAGPKKFAEMTGRTVAEARALIEKYDTRLPFIRKLSNLCQSFVEERHYIDLIDGTRRHWTTFEMPGVPWGSGTGPCTMDVALQRLADPEHPWHGKPEKWLRRSHMHTAMNARIQGNAARQTKMAMRDLYRAGVVPLLQMHDCLDCSISSKEQGELIAEIMRDALPLKIPMHVDVKYGRTWGDAEHSWEELQETVATQAEPERPPASLSAAATGETTPDIPPWMPVTDAPEPVQEPIKPNGAAEPEPQKTHPTPPVQPQINDGFASWEDDTAREPTWRPNGVDAAGSIQDQVTGHMVSLNREVPDNLIVDGKYHRHGPKDALWYRIIPLSSGAVWTFGDWRITDDYNRGETTAARPLTTEELTERCREHEKMLADNDAKRKCNQLKAAADAQRRWDQAIPAPVDHPYLVKKRIEPCGARLEGNALLIPMFDAQGTVQSVQEISPNGRKHNQKDGRRKGCFFPIGEPGDLFLIGEGFATCATLHAATGLGVIAAGDAGNLGIVAKTVRELFPDATICVCADDDWKTRTGNAGKIAAEKAAKEINGVLCMPRFRADRPDEATDFNDMAALYGLETVSQAIEAALEPIGNPVDDTGTAAPQATLKQEEVIEPVDLWGQFDPPLLPRGLCLRLSSNSPLKKQS